MNIDNRKYLDLACAHINNNPLTWSCRSLATATYKSWGSWQHLYGTVANLARDLISYSNQGDNQIAYHCRQQLIIDLLSCEHHLRPTPLSVYAQIALATRFGLEAPDTTYSKAIYLESLRLMISESPPSKIHSGTKKTVVSALLTKPYFSVSALIKDKQCSRGAFYHHFTSLENARMAAIVHSCTRLP